MEKFDLHILGCGSALPTVRHNPSSQVLNLREKLYMIDCGEGTQLQLRRSKLKFARLNHVFISHIHGDHCFGLIGMISTFSMLGRTADLHVYAPEALESVLRLELATFCRGLEFQVIFHAHPGGHALIYEDRSVAVYTIPLSHRVPSTGFLFCEKPVLPHIRRDMVDYLGIPFYAIQSIKEGAGWTTADGRVVPHERLVFPAEAPRRYAYCSDTTYLPCLADYVKGVDLLFHEATFGEDNRARAAETFHSTAKQAAMLARDAGVKRLLIGHYSARYTDERVLLDEAREIFPDTLLAEEGMMLTL